MRTAKTQPLSFVVRGPILRAATKRGLPSFPRLVQDGDLVCRPRLASSPNVLPFLSSFPLCVLVGQSAVALRPWLPTLPSPRLPCRFSSTHLTCGWESTKALINIHNCCFPQLVRLMKCSAYLSLLPYICSPWCPSFTKLRIPFKSFFFFADLTHPPIFHFHVIHSGRGTCLFSSIVVLTTLRGRTAHSTGKTVRSTLSGPKATGTTFPRNFPSRMLSMTRLFPCVSVSPASTKEVC